MFLLILMVIASFSEVITIGAVLPFIGVLASPELIYEHHLAQRIIQFLLISNENQLKFAIMIAFVIAVILTGLIRLALLFFITRLSYAVGHDISVDIYRRTLYQGYSVHIGRNSSEVITGVIKKTNTVIGGILTPVLMFSSSMFFFTGIILTLFFIDYTIALASLVAFGMIYYGVIRYTRKSVNENSKSIAIQSVNIVKSLQEGMGGIRDILINGSQEFYCKLYSNADLSLRRAEGKNYFISGSPRFVIESAGISLIAVLAYISSVEKGGLVSIMPVLAALTLGAQRLLPIIQQAYASYTHIKTSYYSLHDVVVLLEQPLPGLAKQLNPTFLPFEREIRLTNLSFRYFDHSPWILKKINLTITKGMRIGFVGVTGSGKSTFLDIFMGLLAPTNGKFSVDDQQVNSENYRSWQAHIAHVPQNIYLADSTVIENIAFGVPKEMIDKEQVEKVAKQAQIAELIEEWPDQYETYVGEGGIRLSGGQRQRIGIARALYKKSDVLIFDEATNALDEETEQAVMESIEGLGNGLTILIVSHRLSTIKNCDQIVEVLNNNISFKESNKI